jgi:hypothetical protein
MFSDVKSSLNQAIIRFLKGFRSIWGVGIVVTTEKVNAELNLGDFEVARKIDLSVSKLSPTSAKNG